MSVLTTSRPRLAGWMLALLAFGQFIVAMDYNIVYVALPDIGADLGFSDQTLQWVVSGYALTFGGLLLLGGRAADLVGRRRMFVTAVVFYGLGSLLGGFADEQGALIAARAMQGVGGALLVPATLSLINTTFAEGAARNRALALWGGAGAAGLALGALLGGLLTHAFGWESVFLVNVPMTIVAVVGALLVLPKDGPRDRGARLDAPGALSATIAVTAIVYGLIQGPEHGWTSTGVLAALVLGAALFAIFLAIEKKSAHALMPLALFRNRSLVIAMAVTFIFMGTFGTQYYLFTVYLQRVLEYGVLATGLAFVPAALVGMIGSKVAEMMLSRSGVRATLTVGLLTGALGMAAFALGMSTGGNYAALLPGIVLISLGQGIGWTGMFVAAASGVRPHEQGIASAMASTTQQIGSAMGLALLVAIANSGLSSSPSDSQIVDGLRLAGFVAAGLTVAGAALALALRPAGRPPVAQVAGRESAAV